MAHTHEYFAKIHASKESQFFGAPCDIPDTDEMTELRAQLSAAPEDVSLIKQLAAKLGFQLRYREALELYDRAVTLQPHDVEALRGRAARYLATLQTQHAYDDYVACRKLKPDAVDIANRVGIAAYMLGRDTEAAGILKWCIEHSSDDPETQIAVSYWLAMAEIRSGGGAGKWRDFDFTSEIGHHTGYRDGLAVLCGLATVEDTYAAVKQSEDSLNGGIVLYALAIWYKQHDNEARYRAILDEIVAWDDFWPGFAYLVAWREIKQI